MKPFLLLAMVGFAMPQPAFADTAFRQGEWQSYVGNFVTGDGRVLDTANGDISHSESQGYGLLLSVLADDRPMFERIWSFTGSSLLVRDDGLAAWRWDPASVPAITDANNATDGDMLIAYGLLRAAALWDEPAYAAAATPIVKTIGQTLLVQADGLRAILPGAEGFTDAQGGPILNPSYWIFEVFPAFADVDPGSGWEGQTRTGLDILRRAALTPAGIPADWVQLTDGAIRPAPGFEPEFGYNGIRIPLYLMRAGLDPAFLRPFLKNAPAPDLAKIDVMSGNTTEPIGEPGYRLIRAAMDCALNGTPVPVELQTMTPSSYYAATLQLLMLDHLRRQRTDCLSGEV
ncbi:glycosyl hydrolase family 8 [Devosia sp.]|uniref:glycosyl hydrolase family 8 n=1 Tax=Devosia sp. TaxID=1871048 RepID=UPI002AFDFE95|nr:glycosyl hydrolase family 8 [Devosia sp.]